MFWSLYVLTMIAIVITILYWSWPQLVKNALVRKNQQGNVIRQEMGQEEDESENEYETIEFQPIPETRC